MSEMVPEGWGIKELGEIASIIMGQSPSSNTYNADRKGVPFFQGKADFGERHPTVRYWCTQPSKIAPKDSILFSVRAPVGDINRNNTQACIGRGLAAISGIAADQDFLFHSLAFAKRKFDALGQGSTFEAINGSELRNFSFLLPPLPEQKKIAAILTSVDDVIESTQKQIDKLQDLKKATMNELLTKGIGHTEFKDSELGRIPKSWEVKAVSEICTDIIDCVNKTAPIVENPTPYKMIRTTNVRHGKIDTENVRYVSKETFHIWTRRGRLEKNDIVFTREAPVGESGLVEHPEGLFLGQRTMLYRANPVRTNPNFLLYAFQSEYCKKQLEDMTGGSTVGHMRVPDCSKIKFLVSPKAEQDRIASIISSITNKILSLRQKLTHQQSLKKSLMQDLLTGKVRVKVD